MIGGNSLIGDFALIKDMNPKMQVRSKNAGANHQIQGGGLVAASPVVYLFPCNCDNCVITIITLKNEEFLVTYEYWPSEF